MKLNKNHLNYKVWSSIEPFDHYKKPDNQDNWLPCPRCRLKPLVWEFDNSRMTACGCYNTPYDRWNVRAESISSWISRHNGSALHYDQDELRKNWNYYCRTGKIKFKRNRYKNLFTEYLSKLFGRRRKW